MKRQLAACLAAVSLVAVVIAVPAASGAPRARAASSYTVKLVDSSFRPGTINARGSATLTFVYAGALTHNIIGPKIPSSYATPRKRARRLTRTYGKGRYTFRCSIHPGMNLYLRVR